MNEAAVQHGIGNFRNRALGALLVALLVSGKAAASQDACPTSPWHVSQLVKDYILDTTLDPVAVQHYLDQEINPKLDQDNQLSLLSATKPAHGVIVVRQRALRDGTGALVGYQNLIIDIIVVRDPASTSSIGVLIAGVIENNQDVKDFFTSKCVNAGLAGIVQNRTEITTDEDGLSTVDTDWDAVDSVGSVHFEAKFPAPAPAADPASTGDDVVGPSSHTIRFGLDPEPVGHEELNRVLSEIPLASAHLDLQMGSNDTNPGLALFDGIDESRITRFRYVPEGILSIEVDP